MSGLQSAFHAEEWHAVHEGLVAGLVHALNNRVAALSGISQLYDAGLSPAEEGMQQLHAEVDRLRGLTGLFRLVAGGHASRREPARLGEALQQAASLLGYHLEARQSKYEVPAESGLVEPVLLVPGDALRFALLLLMSGARAIGTSGPAQGTGTRGTVQAAIAAVGDESVVSVVAPGSVEAVRASVEFQVLAAVAKREGGDATCADGGEGGVLLTLALPGLNKATARG